MTDVSPTAALAIRPAVAGDGPGLLAIYNDAVLNTTSIWNETPSDLKGRLKWLEERTKAGFPVIVAEIDRAVGGYATYGPFRPHEGYRHTAELSIYVRADLRGRGIGRALLAALIEIARTAKVHVLVGGIEANNAASIALHASLGFETAARLPQVGAKFGRWLDLQFMTKVLDDGPPAA